MRVRETTSVRANRHVKMHCVDAMPTVPHRAMACLTLKEVVAISAIVNIIATTAIVISSAHGCAGTRCFCGSRLREHSLLLWPLELSSSLSSPHSSSYHSCMRTRCCRQRVALGLHGDSWQGGHDGNDHSRLNNRRQAVSRPYQLWRWSNCSVRVTLAL